MLTASYRSVCTSHLSSIRPLHTRRQLHSSFVSLKLSVTGPHKRSTYKSQHRRANIIRAEPDETLREGQTSTAVETGDALGSAADATTSSDISQEQPVQNFSEAFLAVGTK